MAARARPETIINCGHRGDAYAQFFAVQVEWFSRRFSARDAYPERAYHNDRHRVAASGWLAGRAERVEGTLFGNGERTGNADLITMAMNLYSRGVDPGIRFANINAVREIYEQCTGLQVHERHPYSGTLVYTAFSGSHQDAIRKGLLERKRNGGETWDVPYLPIDPSDIGRQYEPIIRINSQSGKGGVAFVMENEFGYHLPKAMHPEFGRIIQRRTDALGREMKPRSSWTVPVKPIWMFRTGACWATASVTKGALSPSKPGSVRGPAVERDGEGTADSALWNGIRKWVTSTSS